MEKMLFLQPRHVYAPKDGVGHQYLSAPLVTFMARLHSAGVPASAMTFVDENFEGEKGKVESADCVGINLVGAPYIPEVIGIVQSRLRSGARAILGGQIINSLLDDEFEELFQGLRDDVEVERGNISGAQSFYSVDHLPGEEEVSSIPIWEQIPDEQMKTYLSREISFYLSQGCKFGCHFCQASKRRRESYRDLDLAMKDLRWLAEKALEFGVKELSIYLSNLDLFQTPEKLGEFLERAKAMGKELGFTFEFRGLATVHSVVKADEDYLRTCFESGLKEVGLGIDGATPHIWKKTGKVHNISKDEKEKAQECIDAIKKTYAAGMQPEMLMVLGHDGGDIDSTIEDMLVATQFVHDMIDQYQVKVHPYLVKSLIPGADAWYKEENRDLVDELIANPEYFKDLDFAASPNKFSHPDPVMRKAVRDCYLKFLCSINALDDIIASSGDAELLNVPLEDIASLNEGKFDR